jgi:NADH-quinone oxidoreductase subunit H
MSALIELWSSLPLIIQSLIKGLCVIGVMFPIGGACSLIERKVSAWMQGRPGPNRALPPWLAWVPGIGLVQRLGVFHLMADGAKMFFKEDSLPGHVNKFYFLLAPVVGMIPALTTVTVVPFGAYLDGAGHLVPLVLANLDIGILGVFAVSSLGVYSLILAGWASNSKYPFLGGIRASAQLISYELAMTLSVIPVFLWINAPGGEGSLSLFHVVQAQSGAGLRWDGLWFIFYMPVSAVIFLVALFAETNRLPFDMAEGEADLVGGFHTEYGAMKWGLFFVAEYSHMMIGSGVFILLFLGGWNPLPFLPLASVVGWLGAHLSPLFLNPIVMGLLSIAIFMGKVVFFIFLFMWVRWTVPRFRYDQVMKLGWQKLLPLAIGNLLFYAFAIAIIQLNLGWLALAGLIAAALAVFGLVLRFPQQKIIS